ncbi:hypothetical protein BGZ67_004907, partial [Mortierella alpina]
MNKTLLLACGLAVLVQHALGCARSRFVFKAVESDEGITSAGMHMRKVDSLFMFPAPEIFERGADPIITYFMADHCPNATEFESTSMPVTIVQEFVSN